MRRIKCSGDCPCHQCTKASRDCLYPDPVERVTISRAELESLQRRCASLERQLAVTERGNQWPGSCQHLSSPPASSRADVATVAPYASGDSQHTAFRLACIESGMRADGASISRYPGETSRATFLGEIKDVIMPMTLLACLLDGDSGGDPAGTASLGSQGQYETHETHESRPILLPPNVCALNR